MSHNIRSKTYMQMAARERNHKAQIIQVALGLLVLLSIVLWNQVASNNSAADLESQPAHISIIEISVPNGEEVQY